MLPFLLLVDLHVAAMTLFGVVVVDAVARGRLPWAWPFTLVALAGAWAAACVALAPSLPVWAFVPVREGFTSHHLREVTGAALDAAPLRDELWHRWFFPGVLTWRTILGLNAVLVGWFLLALVGWARVVVAHGATRWGLVLHALLLPCTLLAARSETAAPLLALLGLLAVSGLGWAASASASRWGRLAGIGLALLVAGLLPMVRPEGLAWSVGLGMAAMGTALPGWNARLGASLDAGFAVLWRWPWLAGLAVVGVVGVSWAVPAPASPSSSEWPALRWVVGGLHPWHVQEAGLVLWLLAFTLTPALAWLVLVGMREALRRPLTEGWLVGLLFVLAGTMRIAAHGGVGLHSGTWAAPWEIVRYALVLLPILLVLAALGARATSPPRALWWAIVPVGVAGALAGLRLEGVPTWTAPNTSSQQEVRALAAWSDAHPHCALLTPAFVWGRAPELAHWFALVPDADGHEAVDLGVDASASWDDAVAALPRPVACVRAWWGLDCQAEQAELCGALEGWELGNVTSFVHVPFVHPDHGVTYTSRGRRPDGEPLAPGELVVGDLVP